MANSEPKYFEPIKDMPEGTVAFKMVNAKAAILNETQIHQLGGQLFAHAEQAAGKCNNFAIDMSDVKHVAMGMLGKFLTTNKKLGGARLHLIGLKDTQLDMINTRNFSGDFSATSSKLSEWLETQKPYFEKVDRTDLPAGTVAYKVKAGLPPVLEPEEMDAMISQMNTLVTESTKRSSSTSHTTSNQPNNLVIDITNLEYANKDMLNMFAKAHNTLQRFSSNLHLVGQKPELDENLNTTMLNTRLNITKSSLNDWIHEQKVRGFV